MGVGINTTTLLKTLYTPEKNEKLQFKISSHHYLKGTNVWIFRRTHPFG